MFIVALGSPLSGKTTCMSRVFADLKDSGYSAEFVTESARKYIAQMRKSGEPVVLTDQDQIHILCAQLEEERLMAGSSDFVVCDSSVLNTLLYLTPTARTHHMVQKAVEWAKTTYDLAFLCQTVAPPKSITDANRVHSWEECQAMEKALPGLLPEGIPVIPLYGDTKYRAAEALRAIYAKFFSV